MPDLSKVYVEQSQFDRLVAAERKLRLKGVREGVREGVYDLFEKFIVGVEREGEPKPVVRSLAEMIAECGFRFVDINITEKHFPLVGEVADVSEMLTVSQKDLGGQDMTTAQIEAAIGRKGYRSATLAEQLAYAKAKWNGKDIVIALGSSWVPPDGFRSVPYLCDVGDGRKLDLYWGDPEDRWREDCLFLVVRK